MISTPCSNGLVIKGVEKVLSATKRVHRIYELSQRFFANHIISSRDLMVTLSKHESSFFI